ncbi:uncharacterized protein Tco025E_00094 [Trypanosoma conorhini]|uniref:Uncharacterized protein n=1 Tax=Trypanosoma conorhini TaxID=83891 RepID=A0A3R7N9L2_9TRYP|nr:uncharacterized protein Tco025E_00094 [Trypanosoma conorhini]RNF27710.1 hypothetical protein Tco025E_00094 [Trypanosoma conorhini]
MPAQFLLLVLYFSLFWSVYRPGAPLTIAFFLGGVPATDAAKAAGRRKKKRESGRDKPRRKLHEGTKLFFFFFIVGGMIPVRPVVFCGGVWRGSAVRGSQSSASAVGLFVVVVPASLPMT